MKPSANIAVKRTSVPTREGVEEHLAAALVEPEAEDFREPVGDRRENGIGDQQHHAVEMRDHEHAVMHGVVHRRDCQHHAGQPADEQQEQRAAGPEHRRGEGQAAAIEREHPVEDLHAGRDADEHGRDREEGVDVRPCPHCEEMVQPDRPGNSGDREGRGDHRDIAEKRLLGEGGDDFGDDAESRQHQEVHLGMAPDPEQVGVEHQIAAHAGGEEMRAEVTVRAQQSQRHAQNGEGGQADDAGGKRGPGEDRQTVPAHAGGAHADDGGDDVDRVQRGADAGDLDGPHPVIDARAGAEGGFGQRDQPDPAGG